MPTSFLLPTAAASLLSRAVGKKLVRVRRGEIVSSEPTTSLDGAEGAVELSFEGGLVISAQSDARCSSVVVREGPLEGQLEDVSRNGFWRWRMRREVTEVVVLKSLDVKADAPELEWGIAFALRPTKPFVLELDYGVDGEVLLVTDGARTEASRRLTLA